MNGRLSKILSVHTYAVKWIHVFAGHCIKEKQDTEQIGCSKVFAVDNQSRQGRDTDRFVNSNDRRSNPFILCLVFPLCSFQKEWKPFPTVKIQYSIYAVQTRYIRALKQNELSNSTSVSSQRASPGILNSNSTKSQNSEKLRARSIHVYTVFRVERLLLSSLTATTFKNACEII